MPVPESRRKTKNIDTEYTFKNISDLLKCKNDLEQVIADSDSKKKYEDKTEEEI